MKWLALFLVAACGPPLAYVSHAGSPFGDIEAHVCVDLGECEEGWACVPDGCEWCDDDDGVPTRCTEGND